jgi:hypothetical protein
VYVSAVQAQLELQQIERLKLKQQQQVQAACKLEEAVAMRQSVRCVYVVAAPVCNVINQKTSHVVAWQRRGAQ